ncbi:MAG: autotransporter outer membrane beta-barrel domain-containing protein [Planctomycetes bacterium]|nr:autotransporter outer membrane beta-barrel domain-containing protein [Planctomycetota bacterium]
MPFGRLDTLRRDCFDFRSEEFPVNATRTDRVMKRVWAEYYNNHSHFASDRNAHKFSLNRNGMVLGYDQMVNDSFVLGGVFNYSNPRLKQATGKITTDDFEFGLYSLIRLRDDFEVKVYAGYAHQRYDINRRVDIPGVAAMPDGIHDNFQNDVSGHSLSASLELTRPFCISTTFRLTPLVALDYEQAWIKGYRESGGLSSLEYRKSDLMSVVARVGAEVDFAAGENITLRARAQYGRQVNKRDYGAVDVRFASADSASQRYARIHGVQTGRNYVNLGAGIDWKVNPARNITMSFRYDADIYKNVTAHTGQVALSLEW